MCLTQQAQVLQSQRQPVRVNQQAHRPLSQRQQVQASQQVQARL